MTDSAAPAATLPREVAAYDNDFASADVPDAKTLQNSGRPWTCGYSSADPKASVSEDIKWTFLFRSTSVLTISGSTFGNAIKENGEWVASNEGQSLVIRATPDPDAADVASQPVDPAKKPAMPHLLVQKSGTADAISGLINSAAFKTGVTTIEGNTLIGYLTCTADPEPKKEEKPAASTPVTLQIVPAKP